MAQKKVNHNLNSQLTRHDQQKIFLSDNFLIFTFLFPQINWFFRVEVRVRNRFFFSLKNN